MADDPQRYVLGVAYQAGPDPLIRRGQDGGRDWFRPEELEKAAWNFLKNGPQAGMFHADGTEGHAQIVESYIWRGPDWEVADGVTVHKGDWLIGAVLDQPAWELYEQGLVTGWSPQGTAMRHPAPPKE